MKQDNKTQKQMTISLTDKGRLMAKAFNEYPVISEYLRDALQKQREGEITFLNEHKEIVSDLEFVNYDDKDRRIDFLFKVYHKIDSRIKELEDKT